MKYICEFCNTKFDTPDGAEMCESAHIKERYQRAAKEAAESKINDAVNAFVTKYGEAPYIQLTEENEKIVFGNILGDFDNALDAILNLLCADDNGDRCESSTQRDAGQQNKNTTE